MPQTDTYIRTLDGATMVAFAPGQYIARPLPPASPGPKTARTIPTLSQL